jgi:hypothetical protein
MPRILLAALLTLTAALAQAQPVCHPDAVSTAPGAYLFTQKGQAFRVFPGQERIAEAWMPLDSLRVCRISGNAFELTNTNHKGEHVEALYETP